MAVPKKEERILVLCVDRDRDLGVKAGIKTPVIGREENLMAATSLAINDPEEADANAMFEAVRIYDRLTEEGKPLENFQIATITGSELGGVGADRKVVAELLDVLNNFAAKEVILVTDGFSDEAILPLVESRVPVTSVRRVVVKHSKSIEETAALFTRYLKTILETPRYSRIALGLPGLLLIILGILSVFNLLLYYWIAFLVVLGSFLIVRGFGIDKKVQGFYQWTKEYSPPPVHIQIARYTAIIGVLSIILGSYQGWNHAASNISAVPVSLGEWISRLPELIGWFISGSIMLMTIGICVWLSGRAIYWYFKRDSRLLRTIVITTVVAWSSQIFFEASQILIHPLKEFGWERLVFAIVLGILLTVAAVLITFVIHRQYGDFFQESEEQIGKTEEN
jgi:putative membrane protein